MLVKSHRFPIFVLLWPIVFSCVAAWLAVAIISDRRWTVSIEAEGIRSGSHLIPWSTIKRFGACHHGVIQRNRLTLFYKTRAFPSLVHQLHPSAGISRERYEKLIEDLQREIQNIYPDLKLGGFETISSDF
jgi:hypothetical protein